MLRFLISRGIHFLGSIFFCAGCVAEVSVSRLGDCEWETEVPEERSFLIYDSEDGPPVGWSHVVTQPEAFPLVKLEPERYAVDESSLRAAEACPERQVFRTVLVRKMSDWGMQHANGIEPTFFDRPVRVGDLEAVTLLVKFHSLGSSVPTKEELAAHYGPYLSAEQIEGLDTGLACLGLSFLESGYNDHGVEKLNAVLFVSFDPLTDFDQWLRVTVPMEAFAYGFEKNYALRPVERESVLDREFVAFRINPEATGDKVSRNYFGDAWDGSVPELYKEMEISLARVEASLAREE